jgi:hypothetical protein
MALVANRLDEEVAKAELMTACLEPLTRVSRNCTTQLIVSLFGSAMLTVVLLVRSTTLCPGNGGLVLSCGQQHDRDRPACLIGAWHPPTEVCPPAGPVTVSTYE